MKKNRVFFAVLILALVAMACRTQATSDDGYTSAPSNTFIVEAGAGAELFLSSESDSGKTITDTANFYSVFYSTNKVKNNLNLAADKQYDKAQAFVLESPHWSNIPGQTIARSEMIVGMTEDLMRSLGFTPGQPTYISKAQMVDLISTQVMNLDVCNFTQCNSGELFYFTVISHFANNSVLDLSIVDNSPESQAILQQTKDLVSKINITTSTDGDARNAFLETSNGYNAIWTYEAEVANINFIRVSQGLEPIYAVYIDGSIDAAQTLFFSPYYQLTDEDKKDSQKVDQYKAILDEYNQIAAAFEKDETIRKAIADSGWRPAQYNAEPSTEVLKPEWGFVVDPQTSTGFAPKYETSMALNQTFINVIRKPIIMFFFDDFSGSMGDPVWGGTSGYQELVAASTFLFVNGSEEFLQAIDLDITKVYLFTGDCIPLETVMGTNTAQLAQTIETSYSGGSTSMFRCGVDGLREMAQYREMCQTTHNCALVFMTDGQDNDCEQPGRENACFTSKEFNAERTNLGLDFIPVYGIPFGNAITAQMEEISGINICKDTIINCFKEIKGSR